MTAPRPGREDIAEISRLCRAILTEWTIADAPDQSPTITALIEESGKRHPARSLQMMAAIVASLAHKLSQTFAERGIVADRILEDIRQHRKAQGDTPELVDCCLDIAVTVTVPDAQRDKTLLAQQIRRAGQEFGAYAMAELTAIAFSLAHNVSTESEGKYTDALAVIAELFADDERSLYEQGEA